MITANAATLLTQLETVLPAASKSKTMPILASVLLESDGHGTRFTATDLDIAITAGEIGKAVERVVLEPKSLRAALKAAKKQTVSIDGSTVKWDTGQSKVETMSVESFPSIPVIEGKLFAAESDLAAALRYVAPCISREGSRFTINGALVDPADGVIVATDGHRLAKQDVSMIGARFLMMKQLVYIIGKRKGNGAVQIGCDDDHISLRIGDTTYIQRKMTGNFPDWKRVMPAYKGGAIVSVKALADALDAVKHAVPQKPRLVKLLIADGEMTVTAGDSRATVGGVVCYHEKPAEIGLDWLYLRDTLRVVNGEGVTVQWKDALSAVLIDGNTVIMPMRM